MRYASINLKCVMLKLLLTMIQVSARFHICDVTSPLFYLNHCSYSCSHSEEEEKVTLLCTDVETKVN